MFLRSRVLQRAAFRNVRQFQISIPRRIINPMLPFDVLEDLDNDELEEANQKLKKEKKKLVKQRAKIEKILLEGDEEKQSKKDEKSSDKKKKSEKEESSEKEDKSSGEEGPTKKKDEAADSKIDKESKPSDNPKKNNVDEPKSEKSEEATKTEKKPPNAVEMAEEFVNKIALVKESVSEKTNSNAIQGSNENGLGNGVNGQVDGNGNEPPAENKEKEEPEEETEEEEEEEEEEKRLPWKESLAKFGKFLLKCLETMGITFSSVAILGVAGIVYHKYYGVHVLDKIDRAFDNGDPAFQLAVSKKTDKYSEEAKTDLSQYWAQRPQQPLLDDIISGKIVGRYFLVIGEKGTGKTSLLLEAMKKVDGYNVAMFDAHADPEIFRLRLGKALNFAYSEDYIGSLFSIRGPRDTTALLDIERAFSKLEELAMTRIRKNSGKPLVLIINNSHLIKENEDGVKLIELLQQKAEGLSGTGLATIIFNSDDYWVYEKLKKLGTRLEVINVHDFSRKEAVKALYFTREKFFPSSRFPDLKLDDTLCNQIYDLIGGRPQHISQVARHKDIVKACNEIIDREKTWFLNQCGLLGEDMDDDVMESGKFSTSAMLLMREFVEMDRERLRRSGNSTQAENNKKDGDNTQSLHETHKDLLKDHHLPELPLWRARQIMTRNDYIQQYDNLNVFTIDSESRVRADSVPMMRAFHEIASQPQFDELLQETIQRVADIESLGRTRELVAKDLVLGGKYQLKTSEDKVNVSLKGKQDGNDYENDDDEDLFLEDISRNTKWWRKRMLSFDESYKPADKTESPANDLSRVQ